MDGDVNQTLGELERRLKELERELEAVGRSGEVDAEPAQASWTATPPPPPGTTPFTATWSGGSAQDPQSAQPGGPPPTPNGAPPIPIRPPYWQPVAPPATSSAPAPEAPPAEEPQVRWTAPAQPAPEPEHAPEPPPAAQPQPTAQPQPQPTAQPQPQPAAQPQPPTPTAATEGLHRQLDELLAFRERLVRSTNELVDELSRVLADLGVELEAVEPVQPDPADTVLTGQVVVAAGPFPNLVTLAAFEQALQRTEGVAAVHVRTLDQGQATIDVTLDEPTRLAAELRERAVVAFEVAEVDEGRLVLAIDVSSDAPLG